MNIAIVEDEYMVAKRLKRFVLTSLAEHNIKVNVFNTLDDANDFIAEQAIDVLFLDLNLNGQDGFDLLKQQLSRSFQTIVVSANTERAIEAFEIGVTDFVAKPFSQDRIDKAIARINTNESAGKSKYLSFRLRGQIELLPLERIHYLKAADHYCEVITTDGKTILHDKSLDKLLLVLPRQFIRIHRSYAVPINEIKALKSLSGSQYSLTLNNEESLPVGRTRVKVIRERLML